MRMKPTGLLLTLALCSFAAAQAQQPFSDEKWNTTVEPLLKPVEITAGDDGVMRAATVQQRAASPWKARAVRTRAEAETTMRLDSLVGYNADGSKGTLQRFEYNEQGLTTLRVNSYYNPSQDSWDDVEWYGYEWTDDGLILDQYVKGYGVGTRYTFKYNDRGWGTEQVIYSLDEEGNWVESSRGEYEYDDRGNIVNERTYSWDGSQWQPATKATAQWDDKNRQLHLEGYEWDGSQWVGATNIYYEWSDVPNPTPVEGSNNERFTQSLSYVWENGAWVPSLMWQQDFDNPDGWMTRQARYYWNGRNWGGEDGSTWEVFFEYDEHNAMTYQAGYYCYNDSTVWSKDYDCHYEWTYDEEGNREGYYEQTFYYYDENRENVVDQYVDMRYDEGYDAEGRQTWMKEWDANINDRELKPDSEWKKQYNEYGTIAYEANWTWKDGERQPGNMNQFTFDEDGNVIEQYSYNSGNSGMIPIGMPPATRGAGIEPGDEEGWVNSSHWIYAYENGTRTEKIGWRWRNEEWTPSEGQTVEYDFDYPTQNIITPEGWTDPYKIDIVHDLRGDGNGGWTTTDKVYFWSEVKATGIAQATEQKDGIEVSFAHNVLTIAGGNDVATSVYDLGGRLVYTGHGHQEQLGHLSRGFYVVRSLVDGTEHVLKVNID